MNYGRLCAVLWLAAACSDSTPAEAPAESRPLTLEELARDPELRRSVLYGGSPSHDLARLLADFPRLHPALREALSKTPEKRTPEEIAWIESLEVRLEEYERVPFREDELMNLPTIGKAAAPIYCGLETRDHQLWLHYGTEKRLYTVKTRDGQTVLASEIDDAQLQRDFPDLHEKVHQGVDALMGDDALMIREDY